MEGVSESNRIEVGVPGKHGPGGGGGECKRLDLRHAALALRQWQEVAEETG